MEDATIYSKCTRFSFTAPASHVHFKVFMNKHDSRCAVTHLICLHWPVFHVEVPNFDGEVVTRHHVASTVTELHVRDGGDDLGEKRSAARILRLLKD